MNNTTRLIKNVIVLLLVIGAGYAIYSYFFANSKEEYSIEDTPLKVEQIRTIAEISTVSYRDEVVMDTIEFYKKNENFNAYNPFEWDDIANRAYNRNIKRRLTVIVKGDVRIGFDLMKHEIAFDQNEDTIWVKVPKAEILDVIITPSSTTIFQEIGTWNDHARKHLEMKAKFKLKYQAKKYELLRKAETNFEQLLLDLIIDERTIIIQFKQ